MVLALSLGMEEHCDDVDSRNNERITAIDNAASVNQNEHCMLKNTTNRVPLKMN